MHDLISTAKRLSQSFFSQGALKHCSGDVFDSINPATAEVIGEIADCDESCLEEALAWAKTTQQSWANFKASDRGLLMTKCADLIGQHAEELAQLLSFETGKALATESRGEIKATQEVFRFYGGLGSELKGETIPFDPSMLVYTTREPVGVVGAIIPWNVPLFLMALKIVPALVAGNAVVVKPSEEATFAVLRLVEIIGQILPMGLLNVLPGRGATIGASIAGHPEIKKVSFTGSVETGRKVAYAAAEKLVPATLELGGKSPMIILPDTDVDEVVEGAFNAMRFTRQGQSCSAASRIFVHRDLHDAFVAGLKKRLDQLVIGDPLDPKTEAGSLISKAQYEKVQSYIQLGAEDPDVTMIQAGSLPENTKGYFVRPTLFTNIENDHRLCQEEIFGPVTCIMVWEDLEDMITDANDTSFGLAASIWTKDLNKAHALTRRIEAGFVNVNQCTMVQPGLPYGGFKDSGVGQEASLHAMLEHYTKSKTVMIRMDNSFS